MADLGTAYVQIVPSAQGIKGELTKTISGEAGAAGDAGGQSLGKRLIGGLAKAGVVAAVGNTLKQAFEAGGDLQQSFGGLETIYGESADAMKEMAMAAAEYGISANTYAEQAVGMGAALKQAFGGDTLAAAQAADMAMKDMADNAAKMGTPVESLQTAYAGFAKNNYTMLDNLKLGYGGTKEEMERLLADAQEISGVEYNIDNLGDVYEAIHVIQGELGLTGVAAEEAGTTLTGSMGAVKASWENVLAALTTGEGLEAALANFSNSFGNFATNVIQMLSNLAPQLPSLILGLADVIIEQAPTFITAGVELIVQLAVGLIQAIPDLIAKLPEIFDGIINAFAEVDWMQLGIDIVKGIINGLASMAGALWQKVKDIIRGAKDAGESEAQTGSPSRLFAKELGEPLAMGIALGVDEKAFAVDDAVRNAISGAASQSLPSPMQAGAGIDEEKLAAAMANVQIVNRVSLQGDARRIFRVTNGENVKETRRTNYNALAAGV